MLAFVQFYRNILITVFNKFYEGNISLEQWFLNFIIYQNHLADLLRQTAGPHLWNHSVGLGQGPRICILTSFHVMLLLVVQSSTILQHFHIEEKFSTSIFIEIEVDLMFPGPGGWWQWVNYCLVVTELLFEVMRKFWK